MKFHIIMVLVFLLAACSEVIEDPRKKRLLLAKSNTGDIVIGVAWPSTDDNFIKGLKLAVEEINDKGGLLDRKLRLIFDYREGKMTNKPIRKSQVVTINVANRFAEQPEVIAVVGHRYSYQAIPASVVYHDNQIIFLAPTSTLLNLTNHHFDYVFRMMPNNNDLGNSLASYAHSVGFKRIVVLHTRSSYGLELSDSFLYTAVKNYNIKIAMRRSFFSNKEDFTSLLIEIKRLGKIDAIFIVSGAKQAANLYRQSRDMNVKLPFIAGESMDSKIFWEVVREWEGEHKELKQSSVVPAVYNLAFKELVLDFVKKFEIKHHNVELNFLAFLGYDAIKLLENGIRQSNSTLPISVAESIRYMSPCHGISGKYEYLPSGEIINRDIYYKQFYQGKFKYSTLDDKKKRISKQICGAVDRDNDGISNQMDSCPDNRPEELTKGISKTGNARGCPIDNDDDGVYDYLDHCLDSSELEKQQGMTEQGCPVDNDKDGVADFEDDCPFNPGITKLKEKQKCKPDADKDNVPDKQDKCPNNTPQELSAGIFTEGKQKGCPKDSDMDLVPDYIDQCIHSNKKDISAGVDEKGCFTDADQDKVKNNEDKCPETSIEYAVDKHGCPVIKLEIIQYDTFGFKPNKSQLSVEAKHYLTKLIAQENNKFLSKIEIIGHTDSRGAAALNLKLSKKRAQQVLSYLIKQGIPRDLMISSGMGETKPLVNNQTKKNRLKNRRIEIRIARIKKR